MKFSPFILVLFSRVRFPEISKKSWASEGMALDRTGTSYIFLFVCL